MSSIVWKPQERQRIFMSRPEYECLFGGAAGGGKTGLHLCQFGGDLFPASLRFCGFGDFCLLRGVLSQNLPAHPGLLGCGFGFRYRFAADGTLPQQLISGGNIECGGSEAADLQQDALLISIFN